MLLRGSVFLNVTGIFQQKKYLLFSLWTPYTLSNESPISDHFQITTFVEEFKIGVWLTYDDFIEAKLLSTEPFLKILKHEIVTGWLSEKYDE